MNGWITLAEHMVTESTVHVFIALKELPTAKMSFLPHVIQSHGFGAYLLYSYDVCLSLHPMQSTLSYPVSTFQSAPLECY